MAFGHVWLDLTRTLSTVGRPAPTGIDRVERAWARHLIGTGVSFHGLCRTTRGYLLLDPDGAAHLIDTAEGHVRTGRADLLSRAAGRGDRDRHRAEAMLRPLAVDRCAPWRFGAMIRRRGPDTYLNVGHANLGTGLSVLRRGGAEVVVLLHDAIPLTHPHLVPQAQPGRFRQKLAQVAAAASLVVTVSGTARSAISPHLPGYGRDIVVAPPGIARPDRVPSRPRSGFVAIGTLEPRKNHDLLLAVWEGLHRRLGPGRLPHLRIFGRPGWRGDAIRRKIETHPLFGTSIFLETAADDARVAAALRTAEGLLYPTLAEGFGLPPWEALAHGALPICSDLPVLREALGARAGFVDPHDIPGWTETIIQRLSGNLPVSEVNSIAWPTWEAHFERVNAAVTMLRTEAGTAKGSPAERP